MKNFITMKSSSTMGLFKQTPKIKGDDMYN
ncbi:hypothetical protein FLBR109950_14995 [Flavobacterium branchiophilum]